MKNLRDCITEGFFDNIGSTLDTKLATILPPNILYKMLKETTRKQEEDFNRISDELRPIFDSVDKIYIETGTHIYTILKRRDGMYEYSRLNLDGTPISIKSGSYTLTPGPKICPSLYFIIMDIILRLKTYITKELRETIKYNDRTQIKNVYAK